MPEPDALVVVPSERGIRAVREEAMEQTALASSWQTAQLGSVTRVFISGGTPSTLKSELWDGDVPWTTSAPIHEQATELDQAQRFITAQALEASATHLVPAHSLLVGTRVGVGKAVVNLIDIAISQDLTGIVLDTTQVLPQFAAYQIKTKRVQDYLDGRKRGTTIKGISRFDLETVILHLPQLAEQQAVLDILNRVQRAITARLREVELERERKAALMQHLFTHGTRGEPIKMTEIGEMPESWDVTSFADLCDTLSVGIVVRPASYYVPAGVPAFRSLNVREDRLVVEDLVFVSAQANQTVLAKSKLRAGDVLIVRTGEPGTSCVVPAEYDGSNCIDIIFARPDRTFITSEFLSRFMNSASAKQQAMKARVGLAQQHLNVGAVQRLTVPVPTLDEQRDIVAVLQACDTRVDSLEGEAALLEELFRALLEELMTGRVSALPLVAAGVY